MTVADIADRADIGRTTFFRHFGDKQEVVFAGEQELLDEVRARHRPVPMESAPDLRAALEILRGMVLSVCVEMAAEEENHRLRERLIDANQEPADRGGRKLDRLVELARHILRGMDADQRTAVLAPWLARACFQAGREQAGSDPDALIPAVSTAFDTLLRDTDIDIGGERQ